MSVTKRGCHLQGDRLTKLARGKEEEKNPRKRSKGRMGRLYLNPSLMRLNDQLVIERGSIFLGRLPIWEEPSFRKSTVKQRQSGVPQRGRQPYASAARNGSLTAGMVTTQGNELGQGSASVLTARLPGSRPRKGLCGEGGW